MVCPAVPAWCPLRLTFRCPAWASRRGPSSGLGAASPPDGEHLGMFGMRERARLLGGEFVATPVSPRGTLVQVSVPV